MEAYRNKDLVIVFSDKLYIFNKDKFQSSHKRILVIDVSKSKGLLERLDKEVLYKKIDIYLSQNAFKGTRNVKLEEIIDDREKEGIRDIVFRFYKKIFNKNPFKLIENVKYFNILLTTIGLLVSYFFYQLGYAFLYGYYFGGIKSDRIPLIDMFVNPVPFNFKSLVVIGFFYLITVALVFVPMIGFVNSKGKKKKILFLFMLLSAIITIAVISLYLFVGSGSESEIWLITDFIIVLIAIPSSLIFIFLWYKMFVSSPVGLISSTIYCFITIVLLSRNITSISKYNIKLFILPLLIIGPSVFLWVFSSIYRLLVQKISRQKFIMILKDFILYFSYFAVIVLFIIYRTEKGIEINNQIINVFTLGSSILVYTLAIIIKNVYYIRLKEYVKNRSEKKTIHTSIKTNKNVFIPIIPLVICLIFLITLVPYLAAITGRMVRETILGLPFERIEFSAINTESEKNKIAGNIVAQTDQIFYISKYPERKLVVIKSPIIYTSSFDYLQLEHNPDKLIALINEIKDNNQSLLTDQNIVFTEIPYSVEVKGDQDFEYGYTLELDSKVDNNSSKVNNISGLYIKYIYDDFGEITNLIIRKIEPTLHYYSSLQQRENVNKVNLYANEFQRRILELFNIPECNNGINQYYYSNYIVDFSIGIPENLDGANIEEYHVYHYPYK